MKHVKHINEVFNEMDPTNKELVNVFDNPYKDKPEKDVEKEYFLTLGKEGKLLKYLKNQHKELTFGLLKAIFDDSLLYKRKREYRKGTFKFLTRAIPMIFAQIFLPISLISLAFGASRTLNKILVPILNDPKGNYPNFLRQIIMTSMNLLEGDYRVFMEHDWFYDIFMVDSGLKKLIRKEHFIDFSLHLSDEMSKKPDDEVVPKKYIQNELKKYIKNTFNVKIA